MNNKIKTFLFTLIILMAGTKAYAYDIEVENADGKTIFYNYINDGKELEVISGSGEYSGDIVIPVEVTYMNRTRKVTSIGDRAFRECTGLTSVTIPNSIKSIGDRAFEKCSALTSVTIGNSVMSIGYHAFMFCTSLTSVYISNLEAWCTISFSESFSNPLYLAKHLYLNGGEIKDLVIPNSVTNIGELAFSGCSVTSVTIPNSVTSIGDRAFRGCTDLTSVTIPNSVTSIGGWAFDNCYGLTSINIPNSVTSIGSGTFWNCYGLTSVAIPNSVTSIGDRAFGYCTGLTSVTIPNSVTSIGDRAFEECNLTTIVSLIKEPFEITGKDSMDKTFSLDVFYNSTLYVPKGTIGKYKSTKGWKDFLFIEEGDGSTNGVASVRSYGVMLQGSEGFISISGLEVGTPISVYNTAGQMVGAANASANMTTVNTTLRSGEIGIVKIGDKSVKVLMK